MVPLRCGGMNKLTSITFTSNGSWTAPAGCTSVILFGRGGSAGGGGGTIASGLRMGGGGCYSTMRIVAVVPNTTYTITIGTAGAGGTNAQGASGGDTSFGSLCIFKGAVTGQYCSQGLTLGGTYIDTSHHYLGGQKSPFAVGGAGLINGGNYHGGGGAGDGAGGDAVISGTGNAGTSGGGGGGGGSTAGNTGGAGSAGKLVVIWVE